MLYRTERPGYIEEAAIVPLSGGRDVDARSGCWRRRKAGPDGGDGGKVVFGCPAGARL